MGAGLQDINKRIKSVKNTRQVTKAMEAVSASKMRRAVEAANKSRDFSRAGWELVHDIGEVMEGDTHPLFASREGEKNLGILITANRGLAGGLNSSMFKAFKMEVEKGGDWKVISIGKKGSQFVRRMGWDLEAAYDEISNKPSIVGVRPVAKRVMDGFMSGEFDRVVVGFTDFKSSLVQEPAVKTILPIVPGKTISEVSGSDKDEKTEYKASGVEYAFEPNPSAVLDALLPRLIETQMYQALLEASASEHSARMVAMRNATENASSMINDLTITFNRARQAAITQEIAEIAAGAAAVE